MSEFIHIVRHAEALTEQEALGVLEVLVPLLLVAPGDPEAIDAAKRTIERMPHGATLTAVMDWWFTVTTGRPSPVGLAFRLPDSLPHALEQAMEMVAGLAHQGLDIPAAEWVQARRDLDRLLGSIDQYLDLDSKGATKLPAERTVWQHLKDELGPLVADLREGRRAKRFELDERKYGKLMSREGIDENSPRWGRLLKLLGECVRHVDEVVEKQAIVQPWYRREVPPLVEALPVELGLGELAPLVFRSVTGPTPRADPLGRAVTERVESRLTAAAGGVEGDDLIWLASIADTWMAKTGADVAPLAPAVARIDAVKKRIQRLKDESVNVEDAELHLLMHDIEQAEYVLDGLEARRKQGLREQALRSNLARFRTPETVRSAPTGWAVAVDEAEALLRAGDLSGAERRVRELDGDLRALRHRETLAELERLRARLAELRAPSGLLAELDGRLDEVRASSDRPVDRSILTRTQDLEQSLRAQRRQDVERRVQTARDFIDTERDLVPHDVLPELRLRLDSVASLAEDDVMAALDQATSLVEDIERLRVHRWSASEGEKALVEHVVAYCTQQLHFDQDDVRRLYVAAKTKPFVILAGLTGSGKSTIARLFAAALGADAANGRFRRIAVRPDWIDQSEVLGSINPLSNRFEPGWLAETARQCERNLDQIHVVLLDEMNLAPVEQYLAEYLSALEESRSGAERTTIPLYSQGAEPKNRDEWPASLPFPPNLVLIGTVNVDETTRVMSERVLDRANVLQLSVAVSDAHHRPRARSVRPWYVPFREWDGVCAREPDAHYHGFLVEVGEILHSAGIGVGQRAHTELERFVANAKGVLEPQISLDLGVLQRIVPKIRGFKRDLDAGLTKLEELLGENGCARSKAVLARWLDESVPDDDYLDGTDARIGLVR
jgi:energy-coupling factor transporter ATP-binding protein EcfA2